MNSIVLITTATAPPSGMMYLTTVDVATRSIAAKAAIFSWATQGVEKIVIADATGNVLLDQGEVFMLKQMNVEVEQLCYFQDDELVKQKGKGYAEGKLMQFALENSEFLKGASSFFKCTGKIYCRNFKNLCEVIEHHQIQNMFWKKVDHDGLFSRWTDTRFYYTTIEFFTENVLPQYLACDDNVTAIESLCFHMLNEKLPAMRSLRPYLFGLCGGAGQLYEDEYLGGLDRAFPCWANN